jgi:branched-chain amino acid transport system ATP-binding protein
MIPLRIRGLCKSFGGLRVTRDVDLDIAAGERRLIIGPNGAGKTTLFNLIAGEIGPDAGEIVLMSRDITRKPGRARAHLGLARTYQIITLFPHDTLIRNVSIALMGLMPLRWNPFADLSRRRDVSDAAHEALERVGLLHLAGRKLSETSYGECRRVEIAMALAQKPSVLLLDEPLAGLSVEERRGVQDLLLSIPREVTTVMIEHDMEVALRFAERITLMHFGAVVLDGTRDEVVNSPRTKEVYLAG